VQLAGGAVEPMLGYLVILPGQYHSRRRTQGTCCFPGTCPASLTRCLQTKLLGQRPGALGCRCMIRTLLPPMTLVLAAPHLCTVSQDVCAWFGDLSAALDQHLWCRQGGFGFGSKTCYTLGWWFVGQGLRHRLFEAALSFSNGYVCCQKGAVGLSLCRVPCCALISHYVNASRV
jgi:hypothetical protein